MTKAALRKKFREVRKQLTGIEIEQYNKDILDRLLALDWSQAHYVHCFIPIVRHHEPDMWAFMKALQERYPAIKLVVSRSNIEDSSMENVLYSDDLAFQENTWGIIEPVGGVAVEELLLDVVVIPLLVADKQGNRVGYGKGFYDRFLAKCRVDCQRIGVCYFDPVDSVDDVDPLDVPLDRLITPSCVWEF